MRYGFDIGGTKIEIAAWDDRMQQLFRQRVPTPGEDYAAFLHCLVKLTQEADQQFGGKGKVGIGLPGITDPRTQQQLAANVPCLNGRNLKRDIETLLNRPVVIGNDCHCFALSEAHAPQTQDYRVVFGAIIGTGAGGGLVVDKQLFRGKHGLAGEWGHLPVPGRLFQRYALPSFRCNCGLSDCYERYVSGRGLLALSQHFGHPASDLPQLMHSYRRADPLAQQIFHTFIAVLASALAGLQLLLDIDAFVLGGGLSNIPEIYPLLPAAMRENLFTLCPPAAILAPVFGDSSGVRGAALLNDAERESL
jgi:N-acetylglucosamine kinase